MTATDWPYRDLDRRLTRIEDTKPDVMQQQLKEHSEDITDVKLELRTLRRALYTFAFSVLAASILFAITVLASGFGHHP